MGGGEALPNYQMFPNYEIYEGGGRGIFDGITE
jgi:hypothetical protein